MKVGKVLELPCTKLLPISFSNCFIKKKLEDFMVPPPPSQNCYPSRLKYQEQKCLSLNYYSLNPKHHNKKRIMFSSPNYVFDVLQVIDSCYIKVVCV